MGEKPSKLLYRICASAAGAAFLAAAAVAVTSAPAQAKKCFAEATGFPCKKCHNSPTGGKEEGWNAYGQKYKKTVVDAGKAPC
jgi:hypothetical protein